MSTDFDDLTGPAEVDAEDIGSITEVDEEVVDEELPVEEDPDAEKEADEEEDIETEIANYIYENKGYEE